MKDKKTKFQFISIQTIPEENETGAIIKYKIKESWKVLEQKGSLI